MSNRRYAIIGSGALGGLYGGMLAKSGFEVHFLLRSDFQHVQQQGLRVDSVWGNFHLTDVNCHQSPETLPACDVTIVALKTTSNHLLPKLLRPPTRQGGAVLVLQNGLDVEADAAAIVGTDRVLGGCCFLCSNKLGPGHIHHLDFGRIVFGEYREGETDVSERAQAICNDLVSAGIDAQASHDLKLVRWRKLMWNIPFNGLSVALNATTKEIMEHPQSEALADALVGEVYATAHACGIKIPLEMIDKTMESTRKMVPYDSSMRLDFLQRRPMEVEAIFGNPLRAGAECGASMPRIEMLYQQLKFIDAVNTRTSSVR